MNRERVKSAASGWRAALVFSMILLSGCATYSTRVELPSHTDKEVERRIQILNRVVGSGSPSQPCYFALASYRQYVVHRDEYRRQKAEREQAEREVRSARWMGDQPGADRSFWRLVAEQNEWRAEWALAQERRAAESAESEEMRGDSSFDECQRLL